MHQLTPKNLKQASLAAKLSALLGVAGLFLFVFETQLMEDMGYTQYQTMMMVFSFGGVGLLMLVYRTLQSMLNRIFGFKDADGIINLIIWLNVAAALVSFVNALLLGEPDPMAKEVNAGVLVMLILVLALGAALYVFSNRIARLDHELWGLMKPFFICIKASGICLVTVILPGIGLILVPGSMVFGAASDLVLSKIFARAAAEWEAHAAQEPDSDQG